MFKILKLTSLSDYDEAFGNDKTKSKNGDNAMPVPQINIRYFKQQGISKKNQIGLKNRTKVTFDLFIENL